MSQTLLRGQERPSIVHETQDCSPYLWGKKLCLPACAPQPSIEPLCWWLCSLRGKWEGKVNDNPAFPSLPSQLEENPDPHNDGCHTHMGASNRPRPVKSKGKGTLLEQPSLGGKRIPLPCLLALYGRLQTQKEMAPDSWGRGWSPKGPLSLGKRSHSEKPKFLYPGGGGSGPPSGRCRPDHLMGSRNPVFSFSLTRERLRVPSSVLEHQQRGHCCHHHSCARCTQHCRIGADGGLR